MRLDSNIIDAIEQYFRYGLPPGSCTTLLLKEEFEHAKLHAHELIKRDDEIWQSHVDFIKLCIPTFCKGKNVDSWRGYAYLTDEEKEECKIIVRLSCNFTSTVARWMDLSEWEFVA